MNDLVRDGSNSTLAQVLKALPGPCPFWKCAWLALLMALAAPSVEAETTWMYTVQINAAVQTAPPRITLSWAPDPYGAVSYTVYRKARDDGAWGQGTALPGAATGYSDTAVAEGSAY